jgi:hypothetical protein
MQQLLWVLYSITEKKRLHAWFILTKQTISSLLIQVMYFYWKVQANLDMFYSYIYALYLFKSFKL